MKKIIHILCIGLLFNVYKVNADTVTPQKAQEIAQAFFYSKEPSGANYRSKSLQLVYTEQLNNSFSSDPAYYIFNDSDGKGFVIISGDDSLEPVLGYSLENSTDPNNIPPSFSFWMSRYKKSIKHNRANNLIKNTKILAKWETSYYEKNTTSDVVIVNDLLNTTWAQGKYYNKFCPVVNGERAVTGCVATAMGQVMKYWEHPSGKGEGCRGDIKFYKESYNWSKMPKKLGSNSSYSEDNAVAKLLYHCGRSVDMKYDPEGSGTSSFNAIHALKEYFRYSDNIKRVSENKMQYSEWLRIMKSQLDNDKPMIMRGDNGKDKKTGDYSAHAWVCSGYTKSNLFYMNWGWGDKKNRDGFYYFNDLTPDDDKDYNNNVKAIIDIIPRGSNYGGSEDYIADIEEQLHNNSKDQFGLKIELFPNPIVDVLHIKSDEVIKQIECYSIDGKTFELHLKQNKVSMKNLPAGVYFIKVTNDKGTITTKKMIKK